MKFIKPYKIFESIERETINDILLDLTDGEYDVKHDTYFDKTIFPNSHNKITIYKKGVSKWFKWDSISDTILRLIDYLGDEFIFISLEVKEVIKGEVREASRVYDKSDIKKLNYLEDDLLIIKVDVHYQLSDYDYMVVPRDFRPDKSITESEIGEPVDLSEIELTSFDDILEPYKSYSPGHHSNDEDYIKRCNLFGRSVVKYPATYNGAYNGEQLLFIISNGRYGYVWFLTGLDHFRNIKEISINKFDKGYFLIKVTFGHHNTYLRLFKDIKSVIKYLKSL